MPANSNGNKRVLQSIERAVAILDYLAEHADGARLSTLSRDLGLNKSTAFGLLSSLEQLGLLQQDTETGAYRLGIRMLQYGLAVQKHMDLVADAKPFLDKLSAQFEETVHMAVLSEGGIVYVAKSESTKSIRMVTQIGAKTPAYCSALGKVLLAALPPEQLRSVVDGISFYPYTPATIRSREELLLELEEVRRSGIAYDREEREPGLFCISAPVKGAHGQCVAAISMSLPAGRVCQHNVEELVRAVRYTAQDISRQLGSQ